MKITFDIKNIDYESIIDMAIPLLKEKAREENSALLKSIAGILSFPGDIPKKMLNALSQEKKDEILVYLISNNREKVVEFLKSTLEKKGISLEIEGIEIFK